MHYYTLWFTLLMRFQINLMFSHKHMLSPDQTGYNLFLRPILIRCKQCCLNNGLVGRPHRFFWFQMHSQHIKLIVRHRRRSCPGGTATPLDKREETTRDPMVGKPHHTEPKCDKTIAEWRRDTLHCTSLSSRLGLPFQKFDVKYWPWTMMLFHNVVWKYMKKQSSFSGVDFEKKRVWNPGLGFSKSEIWEFQLTYDWLTKRLVNALQNLNNAVVTLAKKIWL